jgi:predicted nucleic acid-binding protein
VIVVDAGAVLEYVVWRGYGEPVADALAAHPGAAFAPEILDVEVLHALRRVGGPVDGLGDASPTGVLSSLPVERVGHAPLLERIWGLRHVCSAYDAAYVALAEALDPGTVIVTTDRRLERAVDALGTVGVLMVPVP